VLSIFLRKVQYILFETFILIVEYFIFDLFIYLLKIISLTYLKLIIYLIF